MPPAWLSSAASWLGKAASSISTGASGKRNKPSPGERIMALLTGYAGSYGLPGSWSFDKLEQARHFRFWTYVGVRAIAEHFAMHPPQVAKRVSRATANKSRLIAPHIRQKALTASVQEHEELEAVPSTDPLYQILHNPNGPDVAFTFWYRVVTCLELQGEAPILKIRNSLPGADGLKMVAELWPLFPHWVRRIPSERRIIEEFEVRPVGGGSTTARPMRFPAEDVVDIKYPSPLTLVYGYSPLTAGAEWIDVAEAIASDWWYSFDNGMWPGMVLQQDPKYFGSTGPKDADMDRLLVKLEQRLRGKEKVGRPIALPPGFEAKQYTRTPVEMSYVDSGAAARDCSLAVHRVSKTVAGITDDVNRAAYVASLANHVENTMNPKYTLLGQVLTEQLAKGFDPNYVIFWPDSTPPDPEQVNKDIETDFACMAITPNEIRKKRGREPYEFGGDDPVGPPTLGVVPWGTGQASEGDELAAALAAERAAAIEPDKGDEDAKGKALTNGHAGRIDWRM